MKEKACKVLGREIPEETEESRLEEKRMELGNMLRDPRRCPEEKMTRVIKMEENGELTYLGRDRYALSEVSPGDHKAKMDKLANVAGGLMEKLTTVREKEKKGEKLSD